MNGEDGERNFGVAYLHAGRAWKLLFSPFFLKSLLSVAYTRGGFLGRGSGARGVGLFFMGSIPLKGGIV